MQQSCTVYGSLKERSFVQISSVHRGEEVLIECTSQPGQSGLAGVCMARKANPVSTILAICYRVWKGT